MNVCVQYAMLFRSVSLFIWFIWKDFDHFGSNYYVEINLVAQSAWTCAESAQLFARNDS